MARQGRANRRWLLVLALALGALLLGCGEETPGGADEQDTSSTVAQETTTSSSDAGTTSTSLSSSEEDLGNGRVRAGGFVKRAWQEGGQRRIEIDYADFLTGDEAERAAAEAGDEVNNDYYIRNVNTKLRTFSVSPGATFELPQGDPEAPVMGGWEDFASYLQEFPGVFWWIERRGEEVLSIQGQWVP